MLKYRVEIFAVQLLIMSKKKKQIQNDNQLSKIYYNLKNSSAFTGKSRVLKQSNLSRNQIDKWFSAQPTYTLHKPIKRKFKHRKYVVRGIDQQWQMDLTDLLHFTKSNNGYRYILTVIDVFSRFAFARGLKTKTGLEVSHALEDIFILSKRQPKYIQSDAGKEFYNQHVMSMLKKYDIELFTVFSEIKAGMVERFNRTLKDRMYRYFTYSGTNKWVEELQDFINAYNNSVHSSIKQTPASINKENEVEVWNLQYNDLHKARKAKYRIGDLVRIAKAKNVFNRGFTPNWSYEEFKIHAVNTKYSPVMYELRDVNNEILKGRFYESELQKIENDDKIYVIDKVIRYKGTGSHKQALVLWKGYKTPTWIAFDRISSLKNVGL